MKNQKGFTLIELLVVIAIIGLLSTLAVVALNNARQKSRDSKRVSDVKQMQTALELYYNDNNSYPAPVSNAVPSPLESGGTTYMAAIPSNPTPADSTDTNCGGTFYTYSQTNGNSSYEIAYCLGGTTGGIGAGHHYATPAGIDN